MAGGHGNGGGRGPALPVIAAMNRPLDAAELAALLRRRPGWRALADRSAILRNYRFPNAAGPVLFFNFFSALLRRSPYDLDFALDLDARQVGVGLGAASFTGITPAAFALAQGADVLAALNHAER